MRLSLSRSLLLFAAFLSVSAHRITVKKIKHASSFQPRSPSNSPSDLQINVDLAESNSFDLNSVHDLIYIANITVGGVEYPVQLDTGSSDLFIKGPTHPIPNLKQTDISLNLSYAIGWANGNIAYAPVEFVGISVPSQALVDADQVNNPALGYGAQGIAGLGFTRLSNIDMKINNTNSAQGRSLLFNLFEANPSEPNFIAFALQRSTQPGDDVEGSFSIGELDPLYSSVSGNERISTWPVHNPYRWNVLLDAIIVNETITVPSTKVNGAPSNKAVVLMDSGSSYTYAPKEICDAIYGNVAGAAFDPAIGYWRVPCSAEINMAFQVGGQVFPIHPLDVNPANAVDPTVCLGSFIPQSFDIGNDFDWLVGDNFLRSVYSVYDFGDFDASGNMGDPYMKFLSIVDADESSIEFHKERGGTPRTNITFVGLDGASVAPSFAISNDISESLELIGKYIPAMLGIVALNALILIVCCVVWMISFCRKRKLRQPAVTARTPRSRQSPIPGSINSTMSSMPMNPRNTYIAGSPQANHSYQPVSMALTEDTFVPPSPAFHSFDREGGKGSPGDRPKSVA
ncbi:putative aspartic-type endopeptidase CTSD [Psilocybe cubensis]|uniref:Peptidase A1 domain-containing protein n=2 Tax=Psilocybe cubensis TaxID=181762 RepID=A0A8H8CKY9_PSICU|nr:putative aspartic-type endopeptidase CTSD [Psilocybe cubensis]KAH9482643.1 putative aspartic-type endopeptidase CTSD [Psilocybe cubensis]